MLHVAYSGTHGMCRDITAAALKSLIAKIGVSRLEG
jgi:hypothetical protein